MIIGVHQGFPTKACLFIMSARLEDHFHTHMREEILSLSRLHPSIGNLSHFLMYALGFLQLVITHRDYMGLLIFQWNKVSHKKTAFSRLIYEKKSICSHVTLRHDTSMSWKQTGMYFHLESFKLGMKCLRQYLSVHDMFNSNIT